MLLASVVLAAIPVIRPLTLKFVLPLARGAGPRGVQLVPFSEILLEENCGEGSGDTGCQGVAWWGGLSGGSCAPTGRERASIKTTTIKGAGSLGTKHLPKNHVYKLVLNLNLTMLLVMKEIRPTPHKLAYAWQGGFERNRLITTVRIPALRAKSEIEEFAVLKRDAKRFYAAGCGAVSASQAIQ
jgi:hypothetical protein